MTNWDLYCKDCKEYISMGQGYGSFRFTCLSDKKIPIVESFLTKHEQHNLVMLTETSEDSDAFIDLSLDSKEYGKETE